jgi:hypothetical protein
VRAQHDLPTLFHQVLDGGQGGADARVVDDFPRTGSALLEGYIEINPHQQALVAGLQVSNRFLVHVGRNRQLVNWSDVRLVKSKVISETIEPHRTS